MTTWHIPGATPRDRVDWLVRDMADNFDRIADVLGDSPAAARYRERASVLRASVHEIVASVCGEPSMVTP